MFWSLVVAVPLMVRGFVVQQSNLPRSRSKGWAIDPATIETFVGTTPL